MASMMTLSLNQLAGIWFSDDMRCSLRVGIEQNRVETCFDRNIVVSEPINFLNDGKGISCKISDSISVIQLYNFEGDELLFHILNENVEMKVWLKKRERL